MGRCSSSRSSSLVSMAGPHDRIAGIHRERDSCDEIRRLADQEHRPSHWLSDTVEPDWSATVAIIPHPRPVHPDRACAYMTPHSIQRTAEVRFLFSVQRTAAATARKQAFPQTGLNREEEPYFCLLGKLTYTVGPLSTTRPRSAQRSRCGWPVQLLLVVPQKLTR